MLPLKADGDQTPVIDGLENQRLKKVCAKKDEEQKVTIKTYRFNENGFFLRRCPGKGAKEEPILPEITVYPADYTKKEFTIKNEDWLVPTGEMLGDPLAASEEPLDE